MSEYLRRDEVLDCFHDWVDKYGDVHTADEMPEYCAIEALEVVEIDTGDLISRQAALVAVKDALLAWSSMPEWRDDKILEAIAELPSAQPEIIRCKDCKHHWTHRCMDSMPIERCDLGQTFYDAEVDFCSLAEKREVTE